MCIRDRSTASVQLQKATPDVEYRNSGSAHNLPTSATLFMLFISLLHSFYFFHKLVNLVTIPICYTLCARHFMDLFFCESLLFKVSPKSLPVNRIILSLIHISEPTRLLSISY